MWRERCLCNNMKCLLLLLLFTTSFHCADVSEDFWSILNDINDITDYGIFKAAAQKSELTKRLYPFEQAYTNSPSSSTATTMLSTVSEEALHPEKKKKVKQIEVHSEAAIAPTDPNIVSESPVVFDLKALRMEFSKLKTRRGKQVFIHKLLLIKYNEVIPDLSSKILWSKVEMTGWPTELKSWAVTDLNPEQCSRLLWKMDEIHFKPKNYVAAFEGESKKLKEALYSELRDGCRKCGLTVKRDRINWREIYRQAPLFELKTQDNCNWSREDRDQIKKYLLHDLIPRLKQKNEEWLLLLLNQIE